MTVCIAVICDNGERVVVAADRMFTAPSPLNIQFETDEQKIETVAANCVALLAGNSSLGIEVLSRSIATLGGKQHPMMAEICETIKTQYVWVRSSKAFETVIVPALGSDFADFQNKGGFLPNYLQVQPQIYQQLVMAQNQFNMDVEIIVAGMDQNGARIARVTHPGTIA